jgi:hypothetical protein
MDGFYIDLTHSSVGVPFAESKQNLRQTNVGLRYYQVPSAYFGYHPDEAPSLYLHRIEIPQDLLFEKKSTTDPDALTWDEAMSESPEEVKKWLDTCFPGRNWI